MHYPHFVFQVEVIHAVLLDSIQMALVYKVKPVSILSVTTLVSSSLDSL
jgi:hypothetical protein